MFLYRGCGRKGLLISTSIYGNREDWESTKEKTTINQSIIAVLFLLVRLDRTIFDKWSTIADDDDVTNFNHDNHANY